MYVFAGTSPSRDPSRNNQYQGIFVDRFGTLKPEHIEDNMKQVTRFSLRLAGQRGSWRGGPGQPFETIQSGDHVNIYCHSLGVGPYARDKYPPTHGVPVLYSVDDQTLIVHPSSLGFRLDPNNRQIIRQYDEGTLDFAQSEAFERKGYLNPDDRVGSIKPAPAPSLDSERHGKRKSQIIMSLV